MFVMVFSLVVVVYWRPYVLHCEARMERGAAGAYPEWCFDSVPNVYSYI